MRLGWLEVSRGEVAVIGVDWSELALAEPRRICGIVAMVDANVLLTGAFKESCRYQGVVTSQESNPGVVSLTIEL